MWWHAGSIPFAIDLLIKVMTPWQDDSVNEDVHNLAESTPALVAGAKWHG